MVLIPPVIMARAAIALCASNNVLLRAASLSSMRTLDESAPTAASRSIACHWRTRNEPLVVYLLCARGIGHPVICRPVRTMASPLMSTPIQPVAVSLYFECGHALHLDFCPTTMPRTGEWYRCWKCLAETSIAAVVQFDTLGHAQAWRSSDRRADS